MKDEIQNWPMTFIYVYYSQMILCIMFREEPGLHTLIFQTKLLRIIENTRGVESKPGQTLAAGCWPQQLHHHGVAFVPSCSMSVVFLFVLIAILSFVLLILFFLLIIAFAPSTLALVPGCSWTACRVKLLPF